MPLGGGGTREVGEQISTEGREGREGLSRRSRLTEMPSRSYTVGQRSRALCGTCTLHMRREGARRAAEAVKYMSAPTVTTVVDACMGPPCGYGMGHCVDTPFKI